MRRKVWLACLAVLALVFLSACEKETTVVLETVEKKGTLEPVVAEDKEKLEPAVVESADEGIYDELLDEFYAMIVNGYNGDPGGNDTELFGGMGVVEAGRWAETLSDALKCVGYAIQDVNGDDIPELIVGAVEQAGETVQSNAVFGVYSSIDGEPVGILDGWYRSCFWTALDGGFIYSGSGGAANSLFGKVFVAAGSDTPVWESFYFSDIVNSETMELGWFYNTSGTGDMDASERLDITEDEFWQIEGTLYEEKASIPMITFYDYKVPEEK